MDKEIVHLFLEVLLVCDEEGVIGREMFAIDGCKLPSNASKEWSGTRKDFQRKAERMEKAIQKMVNNHHANDKAGTDKDIRDKEKKYTKTLRKQLNKIREWLDNNDDRIGKSGKPIKSNITDNESAVGKPPFVHIRTILRLDRFTHRFQKEVDIQWNCSALSIT